jgi:hypothetical protein
MEIEPAKVVVRRPTRVNNKQDKAENDAVEEEEEDKEGEVDEDEEEEEELEDDDDDEEEDSSSREKRYEVKVILGHAHTPKGVIFQVRWATYPADTDTWEPLANLISCSELLGAYLNVTLPASTN